jgi:hypothetical protein
MYRDIRIFVFKIYPIARLSLEFGQLRDIRLAEIRVALSATKIFLHGTQ